MQTLTLGKTNLSISNVGLGGLPFGGLLGRVSKFETLRTIEAAVEGGITLFDTSPAYGGGVAEELLGEAVRPVSDKVVIATKIGAGIDSTGHFWCLNNRPNILRQVDGSLRRLQREHIDIYFIPGDDPTTPIGETVEAMEELRGRQKIHFIGYCTADTDCLREAMKHGRIDVVQTPYNIFDRSIATELIPFCRATQIPIIACEPFCRGLLTGALHKHSSFDSDDLRIEDKRFRGEQYRNNIENVNRLRTIAEQEGLSLIQLAVGWILQNPMISSVLCGAKTRLQIRQSIIASGTEMKPDTVIAIDQVIGEDVRQRSKFEV
jgi:aryl-alcohol dehydrogenase-like predicted oxidoreductase